MSEHAFARSSRRLSRLVLLSFCLAPFARPIAAQQRDTVELEEIVVSADRVPTPPSRTVASITVITGEELRRRGIYFVEQALSQVPGAVIVPTGSYGGITSLFLRGGESDYTKVLIDGIPVNQAGGGYDFGTLSSDNVERIEVVRGPVSVLYGSDAVTGVVQIFTRRGTSGFRANAESEAGSHGTWRGGVGASGGNDQVSFSTTLSRFGTDGTYQFNSSYSSTVASGTVSLRPDDRTQVTLTARTGDNIFHFPTDFAGEANDSNQVSRENGSSLGLQLGRRLNDRTEVQVLLASHRQTDGTGNLPDSPGDSLGFYSQSQGRFLRQSADARGIVRLTPAARLTVGGLAEFQDLEEFSTSSAPFAASRRNFGGYGQAVIDVGQRALLNLGARVDDNEEFGDHFTYRVGAVYSLTPASRVRGSFGSGYKEPSLRENFAQSAFEVGNPDLKPETSRSWELGVEQSLMAGQLTLAAVYFDQRFRDLIQYNGGAAPGSPTYANVARASSRGVELTGQVRPGRQLSVTASYTYLRTRVEDAGFSSGEGEVFVEGEQLIRRPRHSASLDGRAWLAGRLSLGLGLNYLGERDDVDFRPFPSERTTLPGLMLVNADASVDVFQEGRSGITLSASVRAENLFDREYDTVVGFPGRGRGVFAGLKVGL